MKGQFSTPPAILDVMVKKLFKKRHPKPNDHILDPGCGDGAFIKSILRWLSDNKIEAPQIVGVESDPKILKKARESLRGFGNVKLLNQDFLLEEFGVYNFVICNPPYVRIEKISESERKIYRKKFKTAKNRFDLYILFFEKALKCLAPSARLVFITPEKYEYTLTTKPLRKLLANYHVVEIQHLDEDAFRGLVTYPTITTVDNEIWGETQVIHRDGSTATLMLPSDGSPWNPAIRGETELYEKKLTLKALCNRVSCGVATGKDRVFVIPKGEVPSGLMPFVYRTVSGKELETEGIKDSKRMIIPYDRFGKLLPENELGELKQWLCKYKDALVSRSCVLKGKRKWYAFHENPPMMDILKPKILCKDIAKEPRFWLDKEGDIVPRHSVYYIVTKNPQILPKLLDYLNSEAAHRWLSVHCQRAANDFLRLQSATLKELPVPGDLNV